MKVALYTMQKTIYSGETTRISLPTVMGQVTILNNHEPYVTILSPGDIIYTRFEYNGPHKTEKEERLPVTGGFLEVRGDNEVKILADS
ncbi:MAG: hypothetical protein COU06_02310 [Candidatus Harrisonbacteria bacterium CG10_big_fil_rev_8_21_14_0_10_38_8]|uniref:ATP synthase F1 complex delta/epsilon subunit N-terminal domain-containing protein n=1 Tax=Candidatus Harrisonbacteria bacterium CG10_big_fil_rev_8_21_14_0_10_38_8 TaxID=1974582 RepID=A0A2M6WJP1_9BACT|nr:MAG: hypothetical protein COU06_02310 [Candidatus Harrisonbacteria bacterium CG10_big_fil_rev_8_21_14_0_10_38_8]